MKMMWNALTQSIVVVAANNFRGRVLVRCLRPVQSRLKNRPDHLKMLSILHQRPGHQMHFDHTTRVVSGWRRQEQPDQIIQEAITEGSCTDLVVRYVQ